MSLCIKDGKEQRNKERKNIYPERRLDLGNLRKLNFEYFFFQNAGE